MSRRAGGPTRRRGRPEQGAAHRLADRRDRLRSRRASRTSTATSSPKRFSSACSRTTISRGRRSSSRRRPRRCRTSPTTAAPTRSASARASTSRPIPAFKGKRRELTADDFVYSFKRFVDPKNRSPWAFLLEGKIEGLDELARGGEAARRVRLQRTRLRACRRSIATRCGSGSSSPTTSSCTRWRTRRSARSRARWSRRTATT